MNLFKIEFELDLSISSANDSHSFTRSHTHNLEKPSHMKIGLQNYFKLYKDLQEWWQVFAYFLLCSIQTEVHKNWSPNYLILPHCTFEYPSICLFVNFNVKFSCFTRKLEAEIKWLGLQSNILLDILFHTLQPKL